MQDAAPVKNNEQSIWVFFLLLFACAVWAGTSLFLYFINSDATAFYAGYQAGLAALFVSGTLSFFLKKCPLPSFFWAALIYVLPQIADAAAFAVYHAAFPAFQSPWARPVFRTAFLLPFFAASLVWGFAWRRRPLGDLIPVLLLFPVLAPILLAMLLGMPKASQQDHAPDTAARFYIEEKTWDNGLQVEGTFKLFLDKRYHYRVSLVEFGESGATDYPADKIQWDSPPEQKGTYTVSLTFQTVTAKERVPQIIRFALYENEQAEKPVQEFRIPLLPAALSREELVRNALET